MEYGAQGGDEKYFKLLICKPEDSRPLGKRGYTRKGDTEVVVKEIRLDGVNWIRSVQCSGAFLV